MSEEQAQQKTYLLTLYISGMCPHSSAALDNIQCLCAGELKGQVELEVVDIRSNPEALIRERILAIPTLIKRLPLPVRRLIGDLGDKERLLKALGVKIDPAGGGGGHAPSPWPGRGPSRAQGGWGTSVVRPIARQPLGQKQGLLPLGRQVRTGETAPRHQERPDGQAGPEALRRRRRNRWDQPGVGPRLRHEI